ncbi:MAG: HK97 gp10 family phage protein [Nitrososphaerota archaeon]
MFEVILKEEENLKDSLMKIYEKIRRKTSDTLLEASIEAYNTARETVHVRTGRLRSSINLERRGDFEFRIVAGYPSREKGKPYYAPFVEFGTRRMPPRPFMKPAAEKAIARVKSSFNLLRS